MALPYLFNSPIKSDFYFVSTKQSTDNKWATKNPIMMRDSDFGILRLRAFGTFSFRIVNYEKKEEHQKDVILELVVVKKE